RKPTTEPREVTRFARRPRRARSERSERSNPEGAPSMYDPKSEPREFLGDDLAEATAKAVSYFALDSNALVLREVADASGPAGRALVVAQPREARSQSRDRGREPRGGREEARGGRERGERSDRGPREGRDRGGRGGRDRGGRDRGRGGRDREESSEEE